MREGDLLAGTEALAKARQNLAKVLEAVGILVSIAAKVAKFVVVP